MELGRRAFLQRLGLALAALGVGETAALGWAGRYRRALAQPTQRKLALLIGIDQYSNQVIDPALSEDVSLRGAVTDVELQRELLIYRFGFQPEDIVTLTNGTATRQHILTAVDGHLVQQAQAGDVVLLHFSGYGSQVCLSDQPEVRLRSLVPVDGVLPSEEHPEVQDVLETELRSLMRSLKTDQVTTVLDAGYRDLEQIRWGTLRVRSRPTLPTGRLAADMPASLAPDEQGLGWPGLLLRAATLDRLALEGDWGGFHAGAFTYALTQTLWETLPTTPLPIVFRQATERVQRWTGPDQQPELTGKRRTESPLPYYAAPLRPAADGMITGVNRESSTVSLWLGGLPASALAYLQLNSTLVVAAPAGVTESASGPSKLPEPLELTVQSRSGLTAAAKVAPSEAWPEVGQPVYEQVRILPKNIDLIVALDPTLERVERVDARSALSGLSFVSSVKVGEQPADCLFGRLPKVFSEALTATLPGVTDVDSRYWGLAATAEPEGLERSYGLFAPNRTLVPGTLIAKGEAVKTAINRLTPHLQTLLALKLLRLTANPQSSQLAVRISLEATYPKEQLLGQWETLRSPSPLPKSRLAQVSSEATPLRINRDSRLRYRVSNYSQQPLYLAFVRFDSRGQFLALVPTVPESRPAAERQNAIATSAALAPGETRSIPEQPADWGVAPLVNWVETFLVFSTVPLLKTWELWQNGGAVPQQPGLQRFDQSLQVARALLADLHAGAVAQDSRLAVADQYSLHTASWATLPVRYPVV